MKQFEELLARLRDPDNCNVLDDVDEAADAIENLLIQNNAQQDIIDKQRARIDQLTEQAVGWMPLPKTPEEDE